jgi:hypothetical protein
MSAFSSIADVLEYDWASKARPEQLPPEGKLVDVGLSGRAWNREDEGGR